MPFLVVSVSRVVTKEERDVVGDGPLVIDPELVPEEDPRLTDPERGTNKVDAAEETLLCDDADELEEQL